MKYNLNDYIAEDGLMSLEPNVFKEGYGNTLFDTCDNDNGIEFLTMYDFLTDSISRRDYIGTMEWTQHDTIPGLYHRNAGRTNYINSDDNLLSMACWAIKHNNKTIFEKVFNYRHLFKWGVVFFPIWNNVTPGKLNTKSKFEPSGFFQPHVWAMFMMAKGLLWEPLSALWLFVNLLFHSWFYKNKQWDRKIITWMRCKSIEMAPKRILFLYRPFILWAVKQFKKKTIKIGGIRVYFNHYFAPHHPNSIEASTRDW